MAAKETKINWKQKLSSRKLWLAVAGIISGVAMVLSENTTEGAALIGSSIIGYLVAEGYIDAKAAAATAAMVTEIGGAIKDALISKAAPFADKNAEDTK